MNHDMLLEIYNREIFELRQKLNQSEMNTIMYMNGLITDKDFQITESKRQFWKRRMNELEKMIKS